MTLCQFVQSYAEYSKKISKDGPKLLEKFESIVFSGIKMDSKELPGTFDGLDQVTEFLKQLRAPK